MYNLLTSNVAMTDLKVSQAEAYWSCCSTKSCSFYLIYTNQMCKGTVKRGMKNVQLDLQHQLLQNEFNNAVSRFTTHELDLSCKKWGRYSCKRID